MSMNRDFDVSYKERYTANRVIERGYEIYDEWSMGGFSSREIVSYTERAVSSVQTKMTLSSSIEALSCLFALDLRIKEKYNTIFKCLFSYFSWRRETNALKRLKASFHIVEEADIRDAIEIELKRLREKIDSEESDDGDDETHGGKRNGKAEEEEISAEKNGNEQSPEKNTEEIAESEEAKDTSEEKTEDISEEKSTEESTKESVETQQDAELAQNLPEEAEQAQSEVEIEEIQEIQIELKEENNVSDEKSEPSTDKKEEPKAYNDAVDSPPLYEETEQDRSSEQTSFLDEIILDNILKGDRSIVGYQRMDDAERNMESDIPQDTVSSQNEEKKSNDKDAYLYDRMIAVEKDGQADHTENTTEAKQEPKQEAKQETKQETKQENLNAESVKQEKEEMRVPLQIDINESQENDMRRDVNSSISTNVEAIEAIKNAQSEFMLAQMDIMEAESMRAKLNIANTEVDMEASADKIGKQEPAQINQTSVTHIRK